MDNDNGNDFNIKLSDLNVKLEPIDITLQDIDSDINITPIDVKLKEFPDIKIIKFNDCRDRHD